MKSLLTNTILFISVGIGLAQPVPIMVPDYAPFTENPTPMPIGSGIVVPLYPVPVPPIGPFPVFIVLTNYTFPNYPPGTNVVAPPAIPNTLTNDLVMYLQMDALPPIDVMGNSVVTDGSAGQLGLTGDNMGVIFNSITAGANTAHVMLTVPDSPVLNFQNSFTASFWVNNEGLTWTSYRAFLDKSDAFAGGHNGWLVYYQTDAGTFRLFAGNGTSDFSIPSSLGPPDPSTWYHIGVRINTTNKSLNLSIQGSSITNITTYTGTLATNNSTLNIFNPVGAGGNGFGGKMDEVAIWNRVLSDNEIQQVYLAGISNHVGFPFDQSVTNVYWVVSARGLNEPTMQSYFQSNSWAKAHLNITNLIPAISMYVTTNAGAGDTTYASVVDQVRTNFPSYANTRTNGYVIFTPGIENDIIEINSSLNGGGITWNITNVVVAMSNSMVTLINRGYKVLAVTCANIVGFNSDEDNWRQYANQWMTNVPGISGFVDVDTFITTNTVPNQYDAGGSEFSEDGKTNMVGHINAKALQVWP